jgi:hypothetical protein
MHHDCITCESLLIDKRAVCDDTCKNYSCIKRYHHGKGSFGGLTSLSEKYVNYLGRGEDIFANIFSIVKYEVEVRQTASSKILSLVDNSCITDSNSCNDNLNVIVRIYILMKIKFINTFSKHHPINGIVDSLKLVICNFFILLSALVYVVTSDKITIYYVAVCIKFLNKVLDR